MKMVMLATVSSARRWKQYLTGVCLTGSKGCENADGQIVNCVKGRSIR